MAGGALSGHMIVTRNSSGDLVYASNNDPANLNAPLWMTVNAGLVSESVQVLMFGEFQEPSWTWIPGEPIYLGINGVMTQVVPVTPSIFLAQVGYATGTTSIYFDQYPAIGLI